MQEQIKLLDKIGDEIKNSFKEFSKLNLPNESCGLITRFNDKLQLVKCRNSSERKFKRFSINPIDYIKASKTGKIVSIIHSHVNQNKYFSIIDKTISEELKLNNILYHVLSDSFIEYVPNGYLNDYLGRIFKWGENDCLSLVVDYYQKELGIKIGDVFKLRRKDFFIREREAFEREEYLQTIKDEGFIALSKNSEFQIHDIIFMKEYESSSFPSHLAVIVDDDLILHQIRNSLSIIEKLTPEIENRIHCVIRHKALI